MTSEQFFKSVVLIVVAGWGVMRLLTGVLLLFQYARLMAVEERLRLPLDETIPMSMPESRWDAVVSLYGWMWFRRPTFFGELLTNPFAARIIGVLSLLFGLFLIAVGIVGLTEVLGQVD